MSNAKKSNAISGSYGCVIRPPLPCTNNKTPLPQNSVGKLHFEDNDFKAEKEIVKVLKEIDPDQETMIYPIDIECTVCKASIQSETNCPYMKFPQKKKTKQIGQLIMPYGGPSLHDILEKPSFVLTRREALQLLKPIFLAVQKLVRAGYVHQDIRVQNIVVSETRHARLIDFGVMKHIDKFYDPFSNPFWRRADPYRPHGPEFRMIKSGENAVMNYRDYEFNYMYLGQEQTLLDYQWYNHNLYNKKLLTVFQEDGLDIFDDNYKNQYKQFLENYFQKDYAKMLLAHEKAGVHEKADVYSLGVVMLDMYPILNPNDDKTIKDKYNDIIKQLLQPDPSRRVSIDAIIVKLELALSNSAGGGARHKNKIRNPLTGRYVLKTGKIGQRLVKLAKSSKKSSL